jgi:cytochrome bd-type quinol oxidase subunit 2
VIKRIAIGIAVSFVVAVAAFFVTFNIYWRTFYPDLIDTDGHLDIPAAGAIGFGIIFVTGALLSVAWSWYVTRRRTTGT